MERYRHAMAVAYCSIIANDHRIKDLLRSEQQMTILNKMCLLKKSHTVVTITSLYGCDGFRIRIRQFFRNPKSDGYLKIKSDRDGFEILVSVQLKSYFRK